MTKNRPAEDPLEKSTELISAKVLLTRQKAMASGNRYRIIYLSDTEEFRIYREERPGRWEMDGKDGRFTLPPSVSVSASTGPAGGSIEIGPQGQVDAENFPVWLSFSDGGDARRSIRVSESGVIQELPW